MESGANTPYELVCFGCGNVLAAGRTYTCGCCGEPLSLRSLRTPAPGTFTWPVESMWRYFDLLPLVSREAVVSLGEGGTPLVAAPRLAAALGLGALWLKNEASNPTGSFKDRQVSVGISHAKEIGADTVAVVSSGNVACAAAAYAAAAGMRAVLLMHGHASPGKIVQAAAYGARAIQVATPSAAAVFGLCVEACNRFGWYHLSTAGMYNAFNVEGAKTIAYELYAALGPELVDWVVAPVGGGGLLGGIWRGFLDLERLGLVTRIPKLAGVQATGCAPLKEAIDAGTPFLETLKHPWPNPSTVAGGIADDILFDGHTVLPAIRRTGGAAIAVDDAATLAAQLRLAQTAGILCEPTSAVAPAALEKLPGGARGERVCCIVTGSGFKDLAGLEQRVTPAIRIAPSLEELERATI